VHGDHCLAGGLVSSGGGLTRLLRSQAIRAAADAFSEHAVFCYAGAACEELYASGDSPRFMYVLGSMGLSCVVGVGAALASGRRVLAFEGDGSILMNLGALVTIGRFGPQGFVLGLVDNGQHGSTGGQPTATSTGVDLAIVAKAAGCRDVWLCEGVDDIRKAAAESRNAAGPVVLHIKVRPGDGQRRLVDLAPGEIRDRMRRVLGA
jgi:sulfopyruvate decarboxylase subunit beta